MAKLASLSGKNDFSEMRRFGKKVAQGSVSLKFIKITDEQMPKKAVIKLGIVIPKKFGNAVKRNKVRRQIREIVRTDREKISSGWYLIAIRGQLTPNDFYSLKDTLKVLFSRAGCLSETDSGL